MWFSCTETYWWNAHTSSSLVIDLCWHIFVLKMSHNFNRLLFLIIYWRWLFFLCKMFLSCSYHIPEFQYCFWLFTDVDYFYVQNVLIIFDWCLCDFLLLKHIDEVYTLHLHLSLTDVDIFFVENILEFQYCFWLLTDVDYFSCSKSFYHSQLMFMWFSCTETYRWSVCTSSSFVIYWCWHIFVL